MVKYYWIFGSIAGVSSAVLEYLIFSGILGFEKSFGVLLGKYLALLICIVFCVVLIKKLQGQISFLRTTFSGLMIALICSAVSGVGYSYMHYPDGHFFDDAKAYHLEEWKKHYADQPQELVKIEEVQAKLDEKFTMKNHTFFDLTGYVVAGLFFAALISAFVADRSSLQG
jgi:uncharacterized membrane protein YraQ (UPF0718 family)